MWDNNSTEIFYYSFCNSDFKLEKYGIKPNYFKTVNDLKIKLKNLYTYNFPEYNEEDYFIYNIYIHLKQEINFNQIAEYLWNLS